MKLLTAIILTSLSLSVFANTDVCVSKKGLFTRLTGATLFDMEPYKKGDFVGRAVYKVVVKNNMGEGVVVQETTNTKLVRTQEEVKELVKEEYLVNIGPIKLVDVSQYRTVQKAEYQLVHDSTSTEVVGRFKSHEELSKKYDMVPCQG